MCSSARAGSKRSRICSPASRSAAPRLRCPCRSRSGTTRPRRSSARCPAASCRSTRSSRTTISIASPQSVGRPDIFPPETRAAQLVVNRGGTVACVGCGHFIYTIRREIVAGMPAQPALRPLGGRSSARWLDEPPDRAGFWRLSTTRAYAWHMGNCAEPWMVEEVAGCASGGAPSVRVVTPPRLPWTSRIPWPIRRVLTQGIKKTALRAVFLRTLGHPHHTHRAAAREAI